MALDIAKIVRNAIAGVVDPVTKSAQSNVQYFRWISDLDGMGTPGYAAKKILKAAIDWKQVQVRTPQGTDTTSRASLIFTNTAALMAATAGKGIGDKDKFILPDGTTGPILDLGGFIDPGTSIPFATEVYLG